MNVQYTLAMGKYNSTMYKGVKINDTWGSDMCLFSVTPNFIFLLPNCCYQIFKTNLNPNLNLQYSIIISELLPKYFTWFSLQVQQCMCLSEPYIDIKFWIASTHTSGLWIICKLQTRPTVHSYFIYFLFLLFSIFIFIYSYFLFHLSIAWFLSFFFFVCFCISDFPQPVVIHWGCTLSLITSNHSGEKKRKKERKKKIFSEAWHKKALTTPISKR
jgi:hypothetical protein